MHTRGLDKGTTTCIPQNSLTLLKILCAPRVPPTYSYPLATAAISTVSIDFPFLEWQSWNHTVCSLVRLASFAEYYALKAPPCLPGLNSSFIIFLPSEELLTFLASRYADNRFLGFFWPEKVFISPSVLKGRFPVYRILAWCRFSLNTVTISVYSLLTCVVSEDKSDVIFIFALL